MAREDTLVHEIAQNYLLEHPIVETTAYDAIKDTILRVLREMFSRHPEYTYVADPDRGFDYPDLDKTRISIWQAYPYETLFLPCLTLGMSSFKRRPVSFNQNIGTVDYLHDEQGVIVRNEFGHPIPNYFEYAGAWDSSISINVNAQSPWDRDLIADFVTVNFVHLYRDWLYTRGIHVKDVSNGGESETDFRNQHIYKVTTSLELYTEWTHRIPIPREYVESFYLKISAPISTSALVPPGGIVGGIKQENVETILPIGDVRILVDEYLNDKPDSAMDTIQFNSEIGEWEIKEEWTLKLARYFNTQEELQMLQTKYKINSLSEISVVNWLSILASISSPFRLGYIKTIKDLENGINEAAEELGLEASEELESLLLALSKIDF